MINLFSNKIKNYLFKKKLKFIDADDPHIIFSDIWSGNSQNGELITFNQNCIFLFQIIISSIIYM